mgnify:CR=1 FL=1
MSGAVGRRRPQTHRPEASLDSRSDVGTRCEEEPLAATGWFSGNSGFVVGRGVGVAWP